MDIICPKHASIKMKDNELSIEKKKNNLKQVSLKIGQNEKRLKFLPLDVKLDEARLILNSNLKCSDFGDNYLFKHPTDGEIDIEDESKDRKSVV